MTRETPRELAKDEIKSVIDNFAQAALRVKAAIEDPDVGVQEIFWSSVPYWGIMLIGAVLLIAFPQIANWLPTILM